ncbi:uncharacterized protein BDZ99DRAFT_518789 [Mytilinidion resinicola]|uniref:CBM-cenC domain-containing protein n=1 Tax=Mytilinidion resinicola TaxID=574789 RepID=A0A6A6YUB5_9PEZI|nr:uncharacterized protein BDZ99DRAFT_518789 [Mytilinidion resinicola]KAF2811527.1 hypothetical protein BDZ99DRAFT_518789 [Mytilinidion resinicola]
MFSFFFVAFAQFLLPATTLSIAVRATDCGGIASGSVYTARGTSFLVEADAVKSFNNLGDPSFGSSFVDCMTRCATTDGCTDLSFTSGGTCYLKQGAVNGVISTETGTCDAKVVPSPSSSSIPTSTCAAVTVTASAATATTTTTATSTVTVSPAAATSSAPTSCPTNAFSNPSFEDFTNGYLASWIVIPSTCSDNMGLKSIETAAASDGSEVLSVQTVVSNSDHRLLQSALLCPGTIYKLSFDARRVSPAANTLSIGVSAVTIVGAAVNRQTMFTQEVSSDAWATFTSEGYVVVPAGSAPVQVGVVINVNFIADIGSTATKEMWIDNLKLFPVTL